MKVRLSDFELDVMAYFWEHDRLSAPALFQELGERRGVTYSTIKTIVDRLEAKGAIKRVDNRGKTILYRAAVSRESVRKPLVKAFLRRVFGNDLRPLFTQLIRDEKLSADEIEYLKRLLEQADGGRRRSR
jgi:BlaI family transcriptional regulator, penicillinase repressor